MCGRWWRFKAVISLGYGSRFGGILSWVIATNKNVIYFTQYVAIASTSNICFWINFRQAHQRGSADEDKDVSIIKPSNDQQLNAITPLTKAQYQDFRSQLNTGDLIFASGNYAFSRAIRRVTRSIWSHVGLIVCTHDRVLVLESIELVGVRLAPLSKYLDQYEGQQPYNGRLVVARRLDIDAAQAQQAVCFGLDALTKPYDHLEIASIVYRALRKKPRRYDPDDHTYLCSELVYHAFAHAHIQVDADAQGFVSPQNIWQHPKIEVLARLL